jgi:hypothetical protein
LIFVFETQVDRLKKKILQLLNINEMLEKGQGIYIAHKNDNIDQALGTFINNYPERERMSIMFLRESEGVY